MNLYELISGKITQDELLNYYNATITYIKLPQKINGCVFPYKSVYNIFIDDNLSYYKKKKTILHELAHIELNQLNQIDKDIIYLKIDKYEDEADRYVKFLLESVRNNL